MCAKMTGTTPAALRVLSRWRADGVPTARALSSLGSLWRQKSRGSGVQLSDGRELVPESVAKRAHCANVAGIEAAPGQSQQADELLGFRKGVSLSFSLCGRIP